MAKALVWAGIIVLIIAGLGLTGLRRSPWGQARVIQLIGKYRGTAREPGLGWVDPSTPHQGVHRIRTTRLAQAKVNDADGTRSRFAAVVVWRVEDTAKAINT